MNREKLRKGVRASGAALGRFVRSWATSDNLSLLAGLAFVTRGAALFSERVAWLTCGSLILALTVLHLTFGGRR